MSDGEVTRISRIVLCLMVKNEEKIIERCLRSVLPHVDGVVVCWNGTDMTPNIARAVVGNLVPIYFEQQPWVNFGHNRTLSAKTAKAWVVCAHPEWPLDSTYLLFMDADMELVVESGFDKKMLTAPGYELVQLNHGEHYDNLRLGRLSQDWRSVGVTHEFWAATPDIGRPAKLRDPRFQYGLMWLFDHNDGGSKSDKTERDIRLLEQGLIDEPGNGRYMFYLARAYADSGKHEQAIEFYRKRRAAGGWDQEVWYAHYREGISLLVLGREAEGIGVLLQAYQERPSRAEPLAFLTQHHRERGQSHLALMFALQASEIPMSDDSLFIWADAHQNLPLREIAISAYYVPSAHEEGILAAETLLSNRNTDSGTYQHMVQTLSFYLKPLGEHALRKGELVVSPEIRKAPGLFYGLEKPNTTEYNCSNPSIVEHAGIVYVNVRMQNYYHERGRVFSPKDPDGVVRTRNVILADWQPDDERPYFERESAENLPAEWDHTTRVRGLEDQRWCSFAGAIWLTATCFNIPSAGGMPRVVLGRFDEAVGRIEHIVELKYAHSGRYEKNWLPWNKGDGKLRLIYGYEPFIILLVDTVTGECTIESMQDLAWPCGTWRGSAAPVRSPAGDGRWLAMIHETAWFEGAEARDQRTVYMHRFIEFDEVFGLTRRSPLFVFDHTGVEYAAGMLVRGVTFPPTSSPMNATVIITHSIEESSAHWKEFSWELVNNMLDGKRP